MKQCVTAFLVWFAAQAAWGQTVVVTQAVTNGPLVWTNNMTNVEYRIEWAPSVGGPWKHSWESLCYIGPKTNDPVTVSIPVFCRVVALPWSLHPTITADPGTLLENAFDTTALTVSGGTPPYVWSMDEPSRGELNSTTGVSVTYTRLGQHDNALTARDSLGDYAIIVIQQP